MESQVLRITEEGEVVVIGELAIRELDVLVVGLAIDFSVPAPVPRRSNCDGGMEFNCLPAVLREEQRQSSVCKVPDRRPQRALLVR